MANDEPRKIEPTLTPIENAPSVTPAAGEAPAETAAAEAAPAQATKADAAPALASEAKTPSAAQSSSNPFEAAAPKPEKRAEPTITRMPALHAAPPKSETPASPEIVVKPRVARFALLAACVAIAASFGAVGGSLAIAKFGPMFVAQPPAPPAPKDNIAEEMKALKDTVAQLRTATKTLSDNLSALKTTVGTSNNAQNAQIGKIAETLDRVEKAQTDLRKTAAVAPAPAHAAAAPETTGSIGPQKQPVPMVLGEPPTTLKPPVVQGWILRRVYDGAALIEGRDGIVEVEPGSIAPGLGRVESIKRQDGRWVVVTSRGLVVGR